MLLLTTDSHPTAVRWAHPNKGRLLTPRCWSSAPLTAEAGIPWAVDNDCFNGFDAKAFTRMVDGVSNLDGCLFVNAPDVVSDHAATLELWQEWQSYISASGLPASFVLQNGSSIKSVPWNELDAVFIGGCTDWKIGHEAEQIVKEAHRRGKWIHMGRVNTYRRIRYAQGIGVHSIDGTKWARFRDRYMAEGIAAVSNGQQLRMDFA